MRVHPGAFCKDAGFEAFHPGVSALNSEGVRDCKENGIAINVWTVNDMAALARLEDWGCDAVMTNYPETAMAWLKAYNKN